MYRKINDESEYPDEYLETEKDIDKYELAYFEEDIQIYDHNPVNKKEYAPTQKYIEISVVN